MPQPNAQNATATAAEFLTRCFAPGETIALFLRREVPRATIQRIVQLETALAPRYLAWLAHENFAGANVYVAANPLRSDSRKRTKECIAASTPSLSGFRYRWRDPTLFAPGLGRGSPAECSPLDIAR